MRRAMCRLLNKQHKDLSTFHTLDPTRTAPAALLVKERQRLSHRLMGLSRQLLVEGGGEENVEAHQMVAEAAQSLAGDLLNPVEVVRIATEGVRHLEQGVLPFVMPSDAFAAALVQEGLAKMKQTVARNTADTADARTIAHECIEHRRRSLQGYLEVGDELRAAIARMNLATGLLGGLVSRSVPLGPSHYAEGFEQLTVLQNLAIATPDLHEFIAPYLQAARRYMHEEHASIPSDGAAFTPTLDRSPPELKEPEVEPEEELPLTADSLLSILQWVSADDRLAFSLTCNQFNAARAACADATLCTLARSTLRSEALRVWAEALGCPASLVYPCWAVVEGLASASAVHLNGRVCRVLCAPNANGRCAIEIDTGWGSLSARQLPPKGYEGARHQLADLTKAARKSVRPANVRVLGDNEMLRATRIMCKGEACARGLAGSLADDSPVQGEQRIVRFQEQALEPMWIPREHSAILYMRAWLAGGQEGQAQIARQLGAGAKPWAPCMCGTGAFFNALSGLFPHEPLRSGMGGAFMHEAAIYRSPLMTLLGRHFFVERVGTLFEVSFDPLRPGNSRDNACISQLMAAPDHTPANNHVWLTDIDSVVAFDPTAHLTPADVLAAWKFALCVDPGAFETRDEFLRMFTADVYDFYLREGRLPTSAVPVDA